MSKVNFNLGANVYLKTEQLKKLVAGLEAKGLSGIQANIAINQEGKTFTTQAGKEVYQDTVLFIKPDAETGAGKPTMYLGNGKVYWLEMLEAVDQVAKDDPMAPDGGDDDLPF